MRVRVRVQEAKVRRADCGKKGRAGVLMSGTEPLNGRERSCIKSSAYVKWCSLRMISRAHQQEREREGARNRQIKVMGVYPEKLNLHLPELEELEVDSPSID